MSVADPALERLADRLRQLAPEQRALFEKLQETRRRSALAAKPPPIPRVSGRTGEGDWPLSLDQERFWFMEQLYPNQAGLNITAASRMRGRVEVPFVSAALAEIARRHAAWRTTFPAAGGRPVQRVAAPGGMQPQRLAEVDLAALPEARRESEAMRLMGEDTAAPFDLERGPLVRSTLVRLSGEDHVCLLTIHHLVTDWISFQIAWAELAALYDALAAGRRPALPEPPVQYSDFALWQREWLRGEVLEELVSWWRERLAGVPAALELPTDRPRPAVPRMRGARLPWNVPRTLADPLRAFGRQEGATVFMTVLALLAAHLHRDSGQEALILGANNANRNRPEIEPVLGCFLTQVPFVVELGGDPSFRELLARVRRSALGAFAHQDLPFGKLVEALELPRDPSRPPLIQALVQVLDGQISKTRLAGVDFAPLDAYDGRARYDLTLSLFDSAGGLAGSLEHDADLFDLTTGLRRRERFLLQAAAAVADPDLPLSALPALSAAARHQAAVEWNDTARSRPGWTAPQRFAEQAAATPGALAVVASGAGGESLSYRDLDGRAEALARRLRALGVGRESRVALVLGRSGWIADIPVAMLGVWKAGGAYVPLDPDSPAARLADLLADAEPAAVVHRGALPVPLPEGARAIDLDVPPEAELDGEAPAFVPPATRADQLAYMIYTSGTTGRPKAVMIEHGGLAAVMESVIERAGLGPGDRSPGAARFSFDAALLEILPPLLTGGVAEILAADEVLDAECLLAACERATVLFTVPAILRRAAPGARALGPQRFSRLRVLGVGSDRVSPELQEEILAAFPAAELHVLYGPTEATIICAAHRVERARRPDRALVGRPLPHVELRVVDGRGERVALGVPGELWIGGPGVARGYFRRDELTAERFVVRGGRRFYRSGDLVRYAPSAGGALEFLGRTDLQVKVRGFRIEPGEVEAALLTHPAMREAVVVARPDGRGDNRLIAYCGASGAAGCRSADLYAHLAARLPAYMIPSAFVVLAELPRTASDKIDRARLPDPAGPAGAIGGEDASAPPATPAEQLVAGVWCDVLALARVSRHANFFALGGHSLLATQVVSRLRAATGAELPIGALFQSPTLAAFASSLEAALKAPADAAAPPVPPLRRRERADDPPLSFAQERLWFLDRLTPGNASYNIPLALAATGAISLPALAAALGAMVGRQEALRTTYRSRADRPVQVIAPPGAWALPLIDLSGLPASPRGEESRRVVDGEVARSFDLERDAVLRSLAVRLEPDRHALLLVVHHIAADGWSAGVMVEEIAALYPAALAGAASPLPELAVQYADFALWQREWLQGEALARQVDHWRERLAGAAELDLPTDRPRPPAQSFRGATRMHPLGAAASAALAGLARREDATLFMVLLAAIQVLLGRYAGQDDVVVGAPIANRTRAELEPLIGFFVNSLVLRGDLAGDPPFAALVARARRTALAAYAHQDLPFERLVEELRPDRRLAHNPLFHVMFALQNAPLRTIALPGLRFAPVDFHFPATRFDLEMLFSETGDGIWAQLTYATDLFDAATIQRLAGHLDALVAAVTSNPALPLSALPLWTEPERHQALVEWNDTAAALPADDLASLVAAQARRRPDAVAVSAEEGELTYGELARRAAGLARRLTAAGVGPETRVALLAQRSPEMIVALLGILAAGGAYVPLDPSYPAERLAFLLADSGARVLLGRRELLAELPEDVGAPVALELATGHGGSSTEDELRSRALADALAYVIYTSGSTGRPKGVEVTHRNVVRLVAASGFAELGEDEVFLQLAPVSFDASTLEIWAPLANGGRVVLFPPRRPALEEIEEALARGGVTSLWLTAGLFHQAVDLLRDERRTAFAALRQLLAGGDVLSPAHVRRALAALPGTRLINGYGPTEVTTFTCCHPIGAAEAGAAAGVPIPIGRPIGNTRAYVLGADLSPLPAGAWGELWAGGEGLARGYLGRPDLTADRFAPDPFAALPGARLYRTGDAVRFRPDGRLEFRGRRDGQVKLRGYRVELGEIESALARHPGIRAAAVTAMTSVGAGGEGPADRRLVAYVVPRPALAAADAATEAGAGDATRQVERWRELYDQTYAEGPPAAVGGEADFNIQGWNSSYTGEPIPPAEMREWRDAVVERLRALPHRRVLEVGCGTGLLLFRLAPEAERYRGTDFSAVALAEVQAEVDRRALAGVELDLRLADDWSGVAPGGFDLVVLNSVVQYFPGAGYLLRVLRGALEAAGEESGAVFVGDVRSLPLLDAFHLSVGLHRASDSLSVAELARRTRRDAAAEEELAVDPALFLALARELAVPRVQILLKRGRSANELTRFRYDVVFHTGPHAAEPDVPAPGLPWEGFALADLERRLVEEAPARLDLRGIPNARLEMETAARELLDGAGREMETVGELRAEVGRRLAARAGRAVEPEELWTLAGRLGYDAELSWSAEAGGADGRFDAVLRLRGAASRAEDLAAAGSRAEPAMAEESGAPPLWSAWANDPLRAQEERRLAPALRRFLEAALPDYMVPSAFVVLEALPLTANGKVDRAALPAPESIGRPAETWVAPATPTEELLAGVVAEVLGIERAGMRDNFFELGGHSLLATQVVSRLTQDHGLQVTLQSMFDAADLGELAGRIVERGPAGAAPARIPRRAAGLDPVPASFAQERLWFMDRLAPGNPAYNISLALRLEGDLRPATLGAVLGAVVRRHEALRTTFRERDGQPVQVVAPAGAWRLPVADLAGLPAPRRAAERLAQELAMRPFDLQRGPLLRAVLLRLGAAEHALLLDMHHIVSDGWSLGVAVREITALYAAAAGSVGSVGSVGSGASAAAALAELPIQYADFAVWQRGWLAGEVLERQIAYWREQMAGAQAALDLPTDRPRAATQSSLGARLSAVLGPDFASGLARLARRFEASPYMVLLAGFQALLGRMTGKEDLTVGAPIANRNRAEVEPLIGFFVNTLMMRGDLSDDPPFRKLLARVRETALAAYAHQDVPFERLVAELRPDRQLATAPLFQVLCELQNAPAGRMELAGIVLSPLEIEATTAQYELELHAEEAEGALGAMIAYRAELFDPTTVRRLLGHLENLLRGAMADPERRLSALPALSAGERQQIQGEWNDTAAAIPDLDLASLFFAQARRRPDAVAVSSEEGELSYGELARRAAWLARRLADAGVGPEVRVALLAERSPAMVAGILGILAAGGAYVPLDPSYPAERLAFLLADSAAPVLLGRRELLDELPAGVTAPVVIELTADMGDPGPASELADAALPPPPPDALAYVIYTSGSTGRPKGVGVTHRNVVRLVRAGGFADLGPEQVFLQLAPISFDASTLELWAPLANGGRLALFPPVRPSLEGIGEALARFGVTSLWLTAGLFHQMVENQMVERQMSEQQTSGPGTAFASLHQLLAGGDVLSPPHVRRALAALPGVTLINGYGPTEVTTFTCCHPMTDPAAVGATVPIGRPIGNTRVHVLGPDLAALPAGAWGELWAGGDGLARGYLGRPDLTAERFVPDPFANVADTPGSRLYRTGDLARFRADGSLEFRARIDAQVKLRGFRVEPGEVESALLRHPAVRASAVALADLAAGPQLAAYVVCRSGEGGTPEPAELRRFLAAELPDYMVPSAFVFLAALPLTPHGKLDRAALPAPEASGPAAETWVAPATPLEERLAAATARVLGLERVGMRDNFFDLGGHSLLATQLVSQLAQEHGIEVSLQLVFDAADLGDLADRIVESELASASADLLDEALQAMAGALSADGGAEDAG